jgi:hypothetical protein
MGNDLMLKEIETYFSLMGMDGGAHIFWAME